MTTAIPSPRWHRILLAIAGCYNLAWGAFLTFAPDVSFRVCGLADHGQALVNVPVWQGLGSLIGVFGVGYLIASADPLGYWPLVFIGLLSKVLSAMGFLGGAMDGTLPWSIGVTTLCNDVVWLPPFGLILAHVWRVYRDDVGAPPAESPEEAMKRFRTHHGNTLAELSRSTPILLIFLRHLGCSFCRQALADAAANRSAIETQGKRLAFVHLASDEQAQKLLAKYGLDDVPRVADPKQELYRAFHLRRSSLLEIFKPSAIGKFAQAFLRGHVNGMWIGDGFRLGGAFVIADGRIVKAYPYASVVDRPDLCEVAT